MSRTEVASVVLALLVAGCAEDVAGAGAGAGGASSSADGATVTGSGAGGDAPGATTTTTTSTSSTDATTGPGSSSATTGSGGAGGGAEGPTPAECFAYHDEESCLAAGCDTFLLHPYDFAIVDGVCQADESVGYCFRTDPEGLGDSIMTYVRDFSAEGAEVLGFTGDPLLLGWSRCTEELAVDHPECCCFPPVSYALSDVCTGITPYPVGG